MLAPRIKPSRLSFAPVLSTVALVAIGAASAHAGALPSADELIEKSTKAMGGKAIAKIESYMSLAEMTAPMGAMTSQVYWAKPKHVFIKQGMPQVGEMTMGTDGEVAWMNNPMMGGYSLIEGKQRDELIEQAIHIRLLNLRETAKEKFEFKDVAEAEFDGVNCFELDFVGKEKDRAEEGTIYFEADSGLIRGMRMNDNGQSATLLLSDWKAIDGVHFFHRMELVGGPMAMSIDFTTIEVNKVDPGVFTVPDEVKELAKKQGEKSGEEMALEDFSPQVQSMIKGMIEGLPWDDTDALRKARESIARQADSIPGEFGKGMKYVLKKVDAALAGGG